MEREFWLERWSNHDIGFHQAEVNPWLEKLWPAFGLAPGSSVFVPLCGKSLDLGWLAGQGHQVYGVELAEAAVRAFYEEAGQAFQVQRHRYFQRYHGDGVTIYCGDLLELTALHLPGVAAVYDRAALIALPPKMREIYADHLLRIVPEGCRILLLTLEYDQSLVPGPPHAVASAEVEALYGTRCRIESACRTVTGQLPPKFGRAGVDEAVEVIYTLVKRS